MEYAKDEIFSIQYNEATDTLELGKNKTKRFFRKNRLLKMITVLAVFFSVVNVVLIYQFFNILKTL